MNIYLSAVIAVLIFWHIGFAIAFKLRRNDIADVFWGLGFIVAALGAIIARARGSGISFGLTEYLILGCMSFWGLRLAYHIGTRFLSHQHEDARYAQWRKDWGKSWLLRSYLQVFLLQSVALILISLPVLRAIALAPREFSPLVIIGAFVWFIGFLFESIGDSQLKSFKKNPQNKGRIMNQGLWSWTRHPNYFGEVVQWWGIFLMGFEPSGWWLIISPVLITFFILKVSGVTMLEELMKNRPGFAEYCAQTSEFFPWPPQKVATAKASTKS